MGYIDGFVTAVPAANKDAYRRLAADAAPLFREFGATRIVEAWGDDVPDGKVTDFKGAVKAEPDEVVVFSWVEYPDKPTRDAAGERMMSDPRMQAMEAGMPFDGKRLIYGGFEPIQDDAAAGPVGYVDGALAPVPAANREAHREMTARVAAVLKAHGATRVVDAWGDQVPEGKLTDYRRAVKAVDGETVVFSWIEWPSRAVRDEAWPRVMADPTMTGDMTTGVFDGKRMVFGGFAPLLES